MGGLSLDHVGLGIRDLEAARTTFARLGFTLSSRSMHAGSLSPGEPVVPWGSGNHCAMFKRGYFELLGLVDESMPSTVKRMVDIYEGLHIVALSTASAEQAFAELNKAGVLAAPPAALERDAAFGPDNEGTRRARFRNIYLDTERYPEARFIVIEHCTPDVLWQDHLVVHPNGAEEISAVYLVAPDIADTARRFEPIMGRPSFKDGAACFSLDRGRLWVLSESMMRALSPAMQGEPTHRVAAACISVRSLAELKQHLTRAGVAHFEGPSLDSDRAIWIAPSAANHSALVFIQSNENRG